MINNITRHSYYNKKKCKPCCGHKINKLSLNDKASFYNVKKVEKVEYFCSYRATPDQMENTQISHILWRPTSKVSSALNYTVGDTNSTISTSNPVHVYLNDNTLTAIPATHECSHEQYENSTPITISKNTSELRVDSTAILLTPKPNTLYENILIAHSTDISAIPFPPNFPQENQYQNTSTVVTTAAYTSYKHKKFNSSCRVGNAQRFVNASPEYQQTRVSDEFKSSL